MPENFDYSRVLSIGSIMRLAGTKIICNNIDSNFNAEADIQAEQHGDHINSIVNNAVNEFMI